MILRHAAQGLGSVFKCPHIPLARNTQPRIFYLSHKLAGCQGGTLRNARVQSFRKMLYNKQDPWDTRMHPHTSMDIHTCPNTCAHTHIQTYTHVSTHKHTNGHTHTHAYTHTWTYTHAHTYVCTHTCTHMHAYTHAPIHHMHTQL